MKASELIAELQRLMERMGDVEVLCQSHGCCGHGHEIELVEHGKRLSQHDDESANIVIRV